MAPIKPPDYSFKSEISTASVMDAIANKNVRQAQLDKADSDRRNQQFETIQQTVATASNAVQEMVQASTKRQHANAVKALGEMLAGQARGGPNAPSEADIKTGVFRAYPDIAAKQMAEQAYPKPKTFMETVQDAALKKVGGDPLAANAEINADKRQPQLRLNAQGTAYELYDPATKSFAPIKGGSFDGPRSIDNIPRYQAPFFDKEVNRYQADPVQEGSRKSLQNIGNIKSILDTDIAAATEPLKSLIARGIASEKGVLTDRDSDRSAGNQALVEKAKTLMKKWYSGKMTEENKTEFRGIIEAISKNHQRVFDRTTDVYVNRISKRFKLSPNEVRDYLKLNTDLGQNEAPAGDAKQALREKLGLN